MKQTENVKPYCVPEGAPDSALVQAYWQDILRDPRLLYGLKRPDGSLYLPRRIASDTADYRQLYGPNSARKQAG